jgi:hypothetical protein
LVLVLALEAEEVIGEISPPPQAFRECDRSLGEARKEQLRISTSPRPGQAVAVKARYLCQIWWGLGGITGSEWFPCRLLKCHSGARAKRASPESTTTSWEYGFRARAKRRVPE